MQRQKYVSFIETWCTYWLKRICRGRCCNLHVKLTILQAIMYFTRLVYQRLIKVLYQTDKVEHIQGGLWDTNLETDSVISSWLETVAIQSPELVEHVSELLVCLLTDESQRQQAKESSLKVFLWKHKRLLWSNKAFRKPSNYHWPSHIVVWTLLLFYESF